jgi:DNA-binding beta-propeller fold protein YncE
MGGIRAGLTYRNRLLNVTLTITLALLALITCMPAMSSAEGYFNAIGNMTLAPTSGPDPYDIILPIDGFYVNAPLLYVANNASVYVLDTSTNKVVDIINISDGNMIWSIAVSPDYSRLYIIYLDGPQYTRNYYETSYVDTIDLKTKNVIKTDYIPTAGRVQKVLMNNDGSRLYVLTKYPTADALYEYDTIARKFTRAVQFSNFYYNSYSEIFDMALGMDGKRLYLANLNHLCINVLDTSTLKSDATTPGKSYGTYQYNQSTNQWNGYSEIRFYGIAVTPDCSKIYLSNGLKFMKPGSYSNIDHTGSYVTVFNAYGYDQYDGSYQANVETFNDPGRMITSPDGSYLYAVDPESAAVRGFSTQTDQEYRSYGTGKYPVDIAITPDGSRIYTANSGTDTVTVINAPVLTYCPPGFIKVGVKPYALFMGKTPASPVFINTSGSKSELHLSHVNLSYSAMPQFRYVNNSTGPIYTLPSTDMPAFIIIPGRLIEIPGPDNTTENGTASPTPAAGQVPSMAPTDVPASTPGNVTATPVAATPGPGIIIALLGLAIVAYRANRKL